MSRSTLRVAGDLITVQCNQSPEHVAGPVELIVRRIYVIRSQRVMLDTHLAELYEMPTFRLNEAVKRNSNRFPEDFMFQLTAQEAQSSTSQFAMSKPTGRGGRRTLPYAFTEHGVAMLSYVLNSERAVQMNIFIIRAFVKLREALATNKAWRNESSSWPLFRETTSPCSISLSRISRPWT